MPERHGVSFPPANRESWHGGTWLSFEERFGMLVNAENLSRHNNRFKRNIYKMNLEQAQASLVEINYSSGYLLDKELIQALGTGQYIRKRHNVIILGATSSGKTYIGCALGMETCKKGFTVKCTSYLNC